MKVSNALLSALVCVVLASCSRDSGDSGDSRVAGLIYNDLEGGIYLKIYAKSGALVDHGKVPGQKLVTMPETSDEIGRLEYTVDSGRLCRMDEPTLRREVQITHNVWVLHLTGC